MPLLWEGFIRCAKLIAPASFGALLQLPKEQLRDIIDKQPSLKSGLREFLMKKSGNKSRVSALLDLFGDDEAQPKSALPVSAENGPAGEGAAETATSGGDAEKEHSHSQHPTPAVDVPS
jgi:symplekin